jgi:hypothetical protein
MPDSDFAFDVHVCGACKLLCKLSALLIPAEIKHVGRVRQADVRSHVRFTPSFEAGEALRNHFAAALGGGLYRGAQLCFALGEFSQPGRQHAHQDDHRAVPNQER